MTKKFFFLSFAQLFLLDSKEATKRPFPPPLPPKGRQSVRLDLTFVCLALGLLFFFLEE